MPIDGKLMQLRATQINLLRMRGIDFKTVMGIYGKYEKGIPVSPEEAAEYEQAIRILRKNDAADSYLSQYCRAAAEEVVQMKAPVAKPVTAASRMKQLLDQASQKKDTGGRPADGTGERALTPAPGGEENVSDLRPKSRITARTVLLAVLAIAALVWVGLVVARRG